MREQERRQFIETMSGHGMPPEQLGLLLVPPVSKDDLEARYAREIEMGKAKGKLQIWEWLWGSAKDGNVAARKYLHQVLVAAPPPDPAPGNQGQAPANPETQPSTMMPSLAEVAKIFTFPARK